MTSHMMLTNRRQRDGHAYISVIIAPTSKSRGIDINIHIIIRKKKNSPSSEHKDLKT